MKFFFPLLFVVAALLSGCGGGGGTGVNGTPPPANQAAMRTAVSTTSLSTRMLTRLQNYVIPAINSAPDPTIRSDGDVFFNTNRAGNTVIISYFQDAQGTQPAGSIVISIPIGNTYPKTATANVSITSGPHTATGSLSIVLQDAGLQSYTITGNLTVSTAQDGPVTVAFSIVSINGVATGGVTVTTATETVSLTNIQASHSSVTHSTAVTGSLSIQPQNINLALDATVNDDGSGLLHLSDGTSATWNTDGSGTITFPGGFKIPFS